MEQQLIHLTIDGKACSAAAGSTILDTARNNGISIPTLCFLKDCNQIAACRVCVVEVRGATSLAAACTTPIQEGMEILTNSPLVIQSRRQTLDLLCRNHRMDCEYCSRYSDCEFHALIREYGLDDRKYARRHNPAAEDRSADYLIRDHSKCIKCRRCLATCEQQTIRAIGVYHRGINTTVGPCLPLKELGCVACGQCIVACPTGALRETDDTDFVWKALSDRTQHAVAIVASDATARIGELFFEKQSKDNGGKTVALLRKLGFRRIYRYEDLQSLHTSAVESKLAISVECPAAVQYCRDQFPALIPNLTGNQTLMQECAEICREKAAQSLHVDPNHVFVVAITPCLAEKTRTKNYGQLEGANIALTTREVGMLFSRACVSRFTRQQVWNSIQPETFDSQATAGTLNPNNCTTATGLSAVKKILLAASSGQLCPTYLRIFACPGGCFHGGGQPRGKLE